MSSKELIIILGPTAVGKTEYSINKAIEAGSPIISCDSRQIYKEMRIGTARPDESEMKGVKHYFIASHSVKEPYTAGKYELEALELISELFITHDKLIVTGGSGLYIDALCWGLDNFPVTDDSVRSELMSRLQEEGIESLRRELKIVDPDSYEKIDIANPQRIIRALEVFIATGLKFSSYKTETRKERPFTITKIGLTREREDLYNRINQRVDNMIRDGLIEEVQSLTQYRDLPALQTVGYKEIFEYLDGESDLPQAIELIKRNSRRYAKRQMTYWRRDNTINWINYPFQT